MKFYRGVIVDNNHPEKNGRCKVRLFDFHASNSDDTFNRVENEALPWAEIMGSTEFGLNSGIGISSVPRQGTMVWCFLENDDPNRPVIMGIATGKPTQDPSKDTTGFSDPDNVYPLKDRLGQPDTSPVLRNATGSTYTELTVLETQSGHVVELDDTPGNNRIKVTHAAGTIIEIDNTGKVLVTTVDNVDLDTTGTISVHATDTITINTDTSTTVNASNDVSVNASGNINLDAGSSMSLSASTITVAASGALTLTGTPININ